MTALVIGAGPAGLMAADVLSAAGISVTLADQMPSVGRKFQMAGKSGLNLTKAEPLDQFLQAFRPEMAPFVRDFGPKEVVSWAEALGQQVFTGSTGRVFPKVMKTAPLLRAWMEKLGKQGVVLRRRWKWTGLEGDTLYFETPDGPVQQRPEVTVLALGGATWPRLGSDAAWAGWMADVAPFAPANAGLIVDWSPHMARHFGMPLKAVALRAGDLTSRGECIITPQGLEGGGIYSLTPALREGAPLTIDFKPDLTQADVDARLSAAPAKASFSNRLRKSLKLGPLAGGLLKEFRSQALAQEIKCLEVPYAGLAPLDEAISCVGGLRFSALKGDLMLRARPGMFAAGEMLDWEAPTGGYLITGCLATGRAAGLGALAYLGNS